MPIFATIVLNHMKYNSHYPLNYFFCLKSILMERLSDKIPLGHLIACLLFVIQFKPLPKEMKHTCRQ